MHSLGMFLPAFYQIAGYDLKVQKEKNAQPIFCPHSVDAFLASEIEEKEIDFTLTIRAVLPGDRLPAGQQFALRKNRVIMDYGTKTEYIYLESDMEMNNWSLYTTCRDRHIDEWFDKVGNLFAWALPGKEAFMLHGVLLEWQGKGIILTAASGTGKSTHARLWRDHENALIINGDRVLLRKEKEQWYAFGTPWSGSSGECVNRSVPVNAIVFLERGDINIAQRIMPDVALRKTLPRIIAPNWSRKYSLKAMDMAIECLECVPLFKLCCRPDAESVKILKMALLRDL